MNARNVNKKKVTEHAWKGTWDRPMKLDEDSIDPLTVARMTDHNVRGSDEGSEPEEKEVERSDAKIKVVTLESSEDTEANDEDQGGKLSPEEAIRIQSKDLPP